MATSGLWCNIRLNGSEINQFWAFLVIARNAELSIRLFKIKMSNTFITSLNISYLWPGLPAGNFKIQLLYSNVAASISFECEQECIPLGCVLTAHWPYSRIQGAVSNFVKPPCEKWEPPRDTPHHACENSTFSYTLYAVGNKHKIINGSVLPVKNVYVIDKINKVKWGG